MHVVEPLATGIVYSISRICRMLDDEFEFHVVHGLREETPKNYKDYFPDGTGFTKWDVGREISLKYDWSAAKELLRIVDEVKPDVIHAHSSKAGALVRLLFWRSGPPVFYSPRGYSFLRKDVSPIMSFAYRVIERVLAGPNTLTVACGLGEYDASIRAGIKTTLIPNLVERVEIERPAKVNDKPVAVMVGGIRPQKNFALFSAIAADPRVQNFQFVWVGDGDIPEGVSVGSNVELTGWLPRDQVLSQLAAADVFLQTSLWEGLPIGVLEAEMIGLPVLAYPAVGNSELVIDGFNGYVCDSVDQFVERLLELNSNRTDFKSMGENGQYFVATEFSPEKAAMRWRSVYANPVRYFQYR